MSSTTRVGRRRSPTRTLRSPWSATRSDARIAATMKISARNQIAGTVTSINEGAAIANVELDVQGQRLVASVTVEAVQDLGLADGDQVVAIIKASDVIIAKP